MSDESDKIRENRSEATSNAVGANYELNASTSAEKAQPSSLEESNLSAESSSQASST